MRDYYAVLGVDRDATASEIKKAYRRCAHRYHPDKNPGDVVAEERFKESTRAYEILSDANKRRRYDRYGPAGVGDAPGGPGVGFSQNVGDVFNEIFGDFFGGKRGRRQKQRGRDRVHHLEINFDVAALGGVRVIDVERTQRCVTCTGTGARPGSVPQLCHACGGSGEIRVQQGLFSVSKRCSYCRGKGRIIKETCATCGGEGHTTHNTQLNVKIPKGASDGTTLRYRGEGEPGSGGGAPGDLRVILTVTDHPVFVRDGADLRCDLPVTLTQAALGDQVEVPTLQGKVRMNIPPGTQSGRVFRLAGKGAPKLGGAGNGDLHVTVVVETPQSLSPRQRELLTELGELDAHTDYPLRSSFWQRVGRKD